jgi:hypothetical protein
VKMFLRDKRVAVSFETRTTAFSNVTVISIKKSQYGSCSIFKPKLIMVLKLLKMVPN